MDAQRRQRACYLGEATEMPRCISAALPVPEYAVKKKRTRREKFLAEMERLVPWARLVAVIEPRYPKSGRVELNPPSP